MIERTVSLTGVAAIGLWVATVVFIAAGTVFGLMNQNTMHPITMALMSYGLACAAGAATMSIRVTIKQQNRYLRSAFELGQDSTGNTAVRRVH